MNLNRVDLTLDYYPDSKGRSKMFIDGVEIKGVQSIEVSAAVGSLTEIVVRFTACVNCDPEASE